MRQRLLKTSRTSSRISSRTSSRMAMATAGEWILTITTSETETAAVRKMVMASMMTARTIILIPATPSNTFSIIIDKPDLEIQIQMLEEH